jgi:hypothetical protein
MNDEPKEVNIKLQVNPEIIEVDIQIQVRVGDSDRGRAWVEGMVESILRTVGRKHLKKPPRAERVTRTKREPIQ